MNSILPMVDSSPFSLPILMISGATSGVTSWEVLVSLST